MTPITFHFPQKRSFTAQGSEYNHGKEAHGNTTSILQWEIYRRGIVVQKQKFYLKKQEKKH
jgi:hypothetical protein